METMGTTSCKKNTETLPTLQREKKLHSSIWIVKEPEISDGEATDPKGKLTRYLCIPVSKYALKSPRGPNPTPTTVTLIEVHVLPQLPVEAEISTEKFFPALRIGETTIDMIGTIGLSGGEMGKLTSSKFGTK